MLVLLDVLHAVCTLAAVHSGINLHADSDSLNFMVKVLILCSEHTDVYNNLVFLIM